MIYEAVYERYSLKPLRAILLTVAILGDIGAIVLCISALIDHILFAAAATLAAVDFILRRISLAVVYSYRYTLSANGVEIEYCVIGKSKRVLTLTAGQPLTPCDEGTEGKKLFGDTHADLYELEKEGKRYIVSLDAYMYSMLNKEVYDDIFGQRRDYENV